VDHPLLGVVARQKSGVPAGCASVCSALPDVLEAALVEASHAGSLALIESTSNQVNQFGGYTGMRPADFRSLVLHTASRIGLAPAQVVLGGDHLGPYPWRSEKASAAMEKAFALARECARAGYGKLHLDASMPLGDDEVVRGQPLDIGLAAERTALLCRAAEEELRAVAGARGGAAQPLPVYVIGTEVPVPGGVAGEGEAPTVTTPAELARTVAAVQDAFERLGLTEAWQRVLAVVVQPGVEFGDRSIFRYDPQRARPLAAALRAYPRLVFEGHSTDYQLPGDLRRMVEDGIAILKVGPALSFAMREALFLLSHVEEDLGLGRSGQASRLPRVLEDAMRRRPGHWQAYYRGSERDVGFSLLYSLSDRARYYWADPEVRRARERLLANLRGAAVPFPLVSQYFPAQAPRVLDGTLSADPESLVQDRVRDVLRGYTQATGSWDGLPAGAGGRTT
jgi:D-tagatose-1,6-bisphosphate aldolase subunit GatZ/KbaZ